MNVLIVGMGRTGAYLAAALVGAGKHRVIGIESKEDRAEALTAAEKIRVFWADGCEPAVLEEAGIRNTDLVVATTGDDEDNLVVAQLAKLHFQVPRVIARVNHPRNHWLFTREWGVDVAVSPTEIITTIIEEEMTLGDLVTLLKLKGGEVALTEITLGVDSRAVGQTLSQLAIPAGAVIVAVMRAGEVIIPGGATRLEAEDEILAVTSVEREAELVQVLHK